MLRVNMVAIGAIIGLSDIVDAKMLSIRQMAEASSDTPNAAEEAESKSWLDENMSWLIILGVILLIFGAIWIFCCCRNKRRIRDWLEKQNDTFAKKEVDRKEKSNDRKSERARRQSEIRDKYNLGFSSDTSAGLQAKLAEADC